jgi:hypothetical protein
MRGRSPPRKLSFGILPVKSRARGSKRAIENERRACQEQAPFFAGLFLQAFFAGPFLLTAGNEIRMTLAKGS